MPPLSIPSTEKYDHLGKTLAMQKILLLVKRNQCRKYFSSAYNEYRMLRA